MIFGTADKLVVCDAESRREEGGSTAPISRLAVSAAALFVAVFTEDRKVVFWTSDFTRKVSTADIEDEEAPKSMVWCGSDAVVLAWEVCLLPLTWQTISTTCKMTILIIGQGFAFTIQYACSEEVPNYALYPYVTQYLLLWPRGMERCRSVAICLQDHLLMVGVRGQTAMLELDEPVILVPEVDGKALVGPPSPLHKSCHPISVSSSRA